MISVATYRGGSLPLRTGSVADDLNAIYGYLAELDQQLNYLFRNIGSENLDNVLLEKIKEVVNNGDSAKAE